MNFSVSIILLITPLVFAIKSSFSDSVSVDFAHKLSFDEEYKLFETELENGIAKHNGKSRHKRYVFLNTETNVDVGFLIVIPVTVVLPGMTNLFNNWRRKRSVSQPYTNATILGISPFHELQARKISSYFDLINIPEIPCQLRALCEFSSDPGNFFPLSDIILNRLYTVNQGNTIENGASGNSSYTHELPEVTIFDQFTKAADNGATLGFEKCEDIYGSTCKYSVHKLLNMPILKFWNKVQSQLRLKLEDITE